MKSRAFAVYEALNHARKEIFIGVTMRPLEELIETRRAALPKEVGHWAPDETITVRGLSDELAAADAWELAGIYVSCYVVREGWRVLKQGADL